ncbi:MAG: nucleotidyltransferase domain-containing protein [Acidobacteriota bacterium]
MRLADGAEDQRERFFGSQKTLEAGDSRSLRDRLAAVNIAVPGRTKGRKTDDGERYCIVQYLRTLDQVGCLDFPIRVEKRERPDFEVLSGEKVVGLECTEAGSTSAHRADAELEKAPRGSVLEGTKLRKPGESLKDSPMFGDEPERLWVEDILDTLRSKQGKLSGYQEFPEQHLLIYDNSQYRTLTAWTVTDLPRRLADGINELPGYGSEPGQRFQRVSVLRDRVLMYDITGSPLLLPVPVGSALPPLMPLDRLGVSELALREFCRKYRIRKLGFFGSVREDDRFGPQSDVDVLVEFEPEFGLGLLQLALIEFELTNLLERKADLRTVLDLSRYFREEVVRDKTELAYVAG